MWIIIKRKGVVKKTATSIIILEVKAKATSNYKDRFWMLRIIKDS